MNRVRNANEFKLKLREIRGAYEQHKRRIEQQREQYTNNLSETLSPEQKEAWRAKIFYDADLALEAHIRQYIVDPLLNVLNWRFDSSPERGMPNLVPEAPVRSSASSKDLLEKEIRFLDYFGIEAGTQNALLIIETKRPSKLLPIAKGTRQKRLSEESLESLAREALLKQLTSPEKSILTEEWQEWIETLRDYVKSVKDRAGRTPGRVVSTNGDWLILFTNPEETFLNNTAPDSADIYVYKNLDAIESRANEIFGLLEYQNVLTSVLGKIPILSLGEIAFYVRSEFIVRAIYGLYIVYFEDRGSKYEIWPIIRVTPIVFLRSKQGTWFGIENGNKNYEQSVPHSLEQLPKHLEIIEQLAKSLLNDINSKLGTNLISTSITTHYDDEESFDGLHGVTEIPEQPNHFLIVTGNNTHYLLKEPTVPECPYHDWNKSNASGNTSQEHLIVKRSINPRAFFKSSEQHYCSHQEVHTAKSSRIIRDNRDRCGLRSGGDNEAFCEIWCFETHLCCRTCAFEEVCTKAKVFQLPCQRPS